MGGTFNSRIFTAEATAGGQRTKETGNTWILCYGSTLQFWGWLRTVVVLLPYLMESAPFTHKHKENKKRKGRSTGSTIIRFWRGIPKIWFGFNVKNWQPNTSRCPEHLPLGTVYFFLLSAPTSDTHKVGRKSWT